ncbi:coiled-coil domain-containing protein [Deinococcus puniceus]|uniref:Uncharacterized protein n=1 Tax=Deinococcus puniceus TaxID=1182568 RepID=A0A172TC96_9DEIO|nr:hypothetical protein [Deinococcus puniceus]ANE44554.1 hypothetical protein SU48_13155 [Deinococcus puniceus]
MSSSALHRLPVRMLGDLVSPRALERIVLDAAHARNTTPERLDAATMEDILKREVFKRLQLSVPAALAKRRVSDVIEQLSKTTQERALPSFAESGVAELEEGAKRFGLYFDWPEAQRLRGLLGVARQEEEAGKDTALLVQEGQDLIARMERRLQEGLVSQAQDLAELQATFRRVEAMGGKDVRRLENLITQLADAQKQGTLLPAEVERARNITFKLRKQLESSVVQTLTAESLGDAPQQAAVSAEMQAEVQARVLALEQEHAARQLADLGREFGPLLHARADLDARHSKLKNQQHGGSLLPEAVDAWRAELEAARDAALRVQQTELDTIAAQIAGLPNTASVQAARLTLDVARMTLSGGGLATDELRELSATLNALTSPDLDQAAAELLLERQRELMDVERAARDVPGADMDLAPALEAARAALARGEDVDPANLWTLLERRMGEAAQQREDFDARADHVVNEYDTVRHLAGETTQRLGRLAESLRAQRRLGPMSADARDNYAQTLADAEAMLQEARAEYRAAQEVTSTFGADALSGLLDVFDFGGGTGGEGGAFGMEAALPASASASPRPNDAWLVGGGVIVEGVHDAGAVQLASLLDQASALGLRHLSAKDSAFAWVAQQDAQGRWRLARARDEASLSLNAGRWVAGG